MVLVERTKNSTAEVKILVSKKIETVGGRNLVGRVECLKMY